MSNPFYHGPPKQPTPPASGLPKDYAGLNGLCASKPPLRLAPEEVAAESFGLKELYASIKDLEECKKSPISEPIGCVAAKIVRNLQYELRVKTELAGIAQNVLKQTQDALELSVRTGEALAEKLAAASQGHEAGRRNCCAQESPSPNEADDLGALNDSDLEDSAVDEQPRRRLLVRPKININIGVSVPTRAGPTREMIGRRCHEIAEELLDNLSAALGCD